MYHQIRDRESAWHLGNGICDNVDGICIKALCFIVNLFKLCVLTLLIVDLKSYQRMNEMIYHAADDISQFHSPILVTCCPQ